MNLCYMGALQEYGEYRKMFAQADTIFLCPNVLLVLRLKSYNERVAVYDDHVSADRAQGARGWLADLLQSWYLDADGKDLTLFDGVSLGRATRYALGESLVEEIRRILSVICAVERYQPSVVAWGSSLGEDWRRTLVNMVPQLGAGARKIEVSGSPRILPLQRFLSAEVYRAKSEKRWPRLPYRLWLWATWNYARLRDLLSYVRDNRSHEILVINYSTLEPIWNEWNLSPELRDRLRLGFLATNPPKRSIAIRAMCHGCAVYPLRGERLDTRQEVQLRTVLDEVGDLLKSGDWARRLRCHGADLSTVLGPWFLNFVQRMFPKVALRAAYLDHVIRQHRPRAVILPYLGPADANILCQLGRVYGFKTVYIPHGLYGSADPEFFLLLGETLDDVDCIVAASEMSGQVFSRALGVDPEKVIPLGSVAAQRAFHYVVNKPATLSRPGVEVLVLDYVRVHQDLLHRERIGEEYFFRILHVLAGLGYRRIVYKLHPGRGNIRYYRQLRHYVSPLLEIELVQDESIFELMIRAEFVVGPVSTAILEAAVLDRPYICVHLDDFPLWPPLDSAEVPVAHDYESLATLVENYRHIWPSARSAILRDGCGLDPGRTLDSSRPGWKFLQQISALI